MINKIVGKYELVVAREPGPGGAYPAHRELSVMVDGQPLDIHYFPKAREKSEGFEVGYLGSAPAALALAILLRLSTERAALSHFQTFKELFLAPLPQGRSFAIELDVAAWVKEQDERLAE